MRASLATQSARQLARKYRLEQHIPNERPSSLLRGSREGVKWELGLALFWTGKMGFTHWDWDLATGNGMNNYKMEWGFFSAP